MMFENLPESQWDPGNQLMVQAFQRLLALAPNRKPVPGTAFAAYLRWLSGAPPEPTS